MMRIKVKWEMTKRVLCKQVNLGFDNFNLEFEDICFLLKLIILNTRLLFYSQIDHIDDGFGDVKQI